VTALGNHVDAGRGVPVVGASVVGTVRLSGGQPAEGAAVTVAEPGTGRQVSAVRTTPSGTFQVGLDRDGRYLVIVSAPGRRPTAALVTVAGGPARHDVVLAGSGALAGTARTAGAGDPVSGVLVTLTDPRGQVVATGTTQADGGYRLDGLEPGDYTLVGMTSAADPVARAVTVPGTADLPIAVTGYPVTAIVRGAGGTSFAGALVTLSRNGGTVATGVSDAQGSVTFAGIPAGRYALTCEGSGPGVAAARAKPGQEARADIRLSPSAPAH
jgi:Carboxypeptidase regulatory-like domain